MVSPANSRSGGCGDRIRTFAVAFAGAAALTVAVGGAALLAQETTPNNMQCIDANSKCPGPPSGLPGGVVYTCNIYATPSEYGDACDYKLLTGPAEDYTCGGTYPGSNCTDTTNSTKTPCYTYEQGTCNLVDVAGVSELDCDNDPTLPKYRPSAPSADFVETCVNQ
jgi:hypothetical protein